MSAPTRNPLSWPAGWPRTPNPERRRARFSGTTTKTHFTGDGRSWRSARKRGVTIAEGLGRLLPELDRLGAEDVIVSTDVRTRADGLPYSNAREPEDPGAAVYFTLDGRPTVLACDSWDRVADNLAAVAAHVGALRGIDRWGVGSLEQVFRGYQALPAETSGPSWRDVLGCPSTTSVSVAREAYKQKVRKAHPDHGGSGEALAIVRGAWAEAQRELGS